MLLLTSQSNLLVGSNTFKDLRTEGRGVTRAKTEIKAGEELTFLHAAKMEGRWYKKYIWRCEESFQKIFVERTIF